MKDLVPVGIVKTSDQVPKDAEGMGGGSGAVGHNGDVMGPVKFVMNKDPKVPNELGAFDFKGSRREEEV